jgi:sulfhydrogenase subunit delta
VVLGLRPSGPALRKEPHKEASKPKVGIFGLTGCAGDQLQILNCEDELVRLAQRLDIVDWVMARSDNDHQCRLDLAFVEGVVATERDLQSLKEIRARAKTLVALGTCAVWGGLPAMRNDVPRDVLEREVYGPSVSFLDSVEALPPTDFVPFDLQLPGCPIERREFLATVNALLAGTGPELPVAHPTAWRALAVAVPSRNRTTTPTSRCSPARASRGWRSPAR